MTILVFRFGNIGVVVVGVVVVVGNKSDELRDPPSLSDELKIEVKYS